VSPTPGKDKSRKDEDRLSFMQLLQSVLAALLGVQSESARTRDFSKGRPLHFIIIGVAATVLLVLIFAGIVRLVLSVSGAG
jgi:hypothetical protein